MGGSRTTRLISLILGYVGLFTAIGWLLDWFDLLPKGEGDQPSLLFWAVMGLIFFPLMMALHMALDHDDKPSLSEYDPLDDEFDEEPRPKGNEDQSVRSQPKL